MSMKLRSKVVEIEAELWDGSPESLKKITHFLISNKNSWSYIDGKLKVWNALESQWINCPVGHYVLKGLKGEFYPCEPEALWMKYEIIDG